ncbi:MAG TPA: DUF5709 domain-containing protein [Pseudonocardiaceae bacterium]|jgi:hypothetical protein|nr:DUF5709 domain-containing protein [Pseudonocardiaceae bacterium]
MDRDEIDDDVFEQLDAQDTLENGGPADPLDEGYSPAERPWAVNDWGTTAGEELTGESLAGRLARELPDTGYSEFDGDGLGDAEDTDGELIDGEVGDVRAGRLTTEPEIGAEGAGGDTELFAEDIGIDGAGASAEEAAVHIVRDDES